jgi:hypothetical protein
VYVSVNLGHKYLRFEKNYFVREKPEMQMQSPALSMEVRGG